ncbi:MAG TPA: hypothetical protein PLQ85_11800 [Anaerolineae bacterium]|nr:hypothetical protein [Anaerolineae bacterium]
MPDVNLTVYRALRSGRVVTDLKATVANANTYFFRNNGRALLHVANGTGSTVTLTFETPQTVDGLAIADRTATLATGKAAVFGPFPPAIYNNGDGAVKVTFNQDVDVTVIQV